MPICERLRGWRRLPALLTGSIVMLLGCVMLATPRAQVTAAGSSDPTAVELMQRLGQVPTETLQGRVFRWGRDTNRWVLVTIDTEEKEESIFPFSVALFDKSGSNLRLLARPASQVMNAEDVTPALFLGPTFDNANWRISPDEVAFGIRLAARLSAGTVDQGQEDLYLFSYSGTSLSCIFHDRSRTWHGPRNLTGNPDLDGPPEELPEEHEETKVYSFSERMTHGHYDLISTIREDAKRSRVVHRWSIEGAQAGYGCEE